jgi:N-acyl-D-aspartate/D-glutamate deacylase
MMDALRKMSLMPAQRLERATAAACKKGRLKEGADAEIVVFDPRSVTDRVTCESPAQPSPGFKCVLVSMSVVEEGRIVYNVKPGRALVRD